ncbi:hypothetical protein HW44_05740 [Nitrosococcus oceani]|nr:hypothetical protein HW44_05740 [Nitrosococcus oceani]
MDALSYRPKARKSIFKKNDTKFKRSKDPLIIELLGIGSSIKYEAKGWRGPINFSLGRKNRFVKNAILPKYLETFRESYRLNSYEHGNSCCAT